MTNSEMRQFFEDLISVSNAHDNVPIECKRLAIFSTLQLVERQANEAIAMEQKEEQCKNPIPE